MRGLSARLQQSAHKYGDGRQMGFQGGGGCSISALPSGFVLVMSTLLCLVGIFPILFHRVPEGAAQRGILLHFCGSPDPSFVQQNDPFLP